MVPSVQLPTTSKLCPALCGSCLPEVGAPVSCMPLTKGSHPSRMAHGGEETVGAGAYAQSAAASSHSRSARLSFQQTF